MIIPGLASVTFRTLSAPDIVAWAKQAGLSAIEWGGDIHVRPGFPAVAEKARRMTEDAGLLIASYGSYFRVGENSREMPEFERILEVAIALGAPLIRVWAGKRPSARAAPQWRRFIAENTQRIADRAAETGIAIGLEFHEGSLTDTPESARDLCKAVNRPNVFCYWQVNPKLTREARFDSLRTITPWLGNLHVFQYEGDRQVALEAGADEWRAYLAHAQAHAAASHQRFALLEFVENGEPQNLLRDAKTLLRLTRELSD